MLAAIEAAGGPTYDFRQINPVDGEDGGEPGGNIRVGFIFRTDVDDLQFVDRPGATATTANAVVEGEARERQLQYSPGRIDPTNPAFANSRKPLAAEFMYGKRRLILDRQPLQLEGRRSAAVRPLPAADAIESRCSVTSRRSIVDGFVDQILAAEPKSNIVVLGDLNDFEFSTTLDLLEGGVLTTLIETLPPSERYSYVFEGNSQSLDHMLRQRRAGEARRPATTSCTSTPSSPSRRATTIRRSRASTSTGLPFRRHGTGGGGSGRPHRSL